MKKAGKLLLICFIFKLIFIPLSFADDEENIDYVWLEETISDAKDKNDLNIYSRYAIIYDRKSKTKIWGKDENQEVPMASTTKIMTAIILLENANLSETVEVVKEAALVGGSTVGLKIGDKITYNDLLYALLLPSRK